MRHTGNLKRIISPSRNQSAITALLRPLTQINGQAPRNTAVASRALSLVSHSSFITLNDSLWLNYEIINYIAQCLIQPSVPVMYCYSTYFFQKLLHETETNTRYDYAQVHNWSNNIEEGQGLFHLQNSTFQSIKLEYIGSTFSTYVRSKSEKSG